MTTPFTPADERWLRSVESTLPGLLDAPVELGLRERDAGPIGREHDLVSHLATYGPRPSALGLGGRELLAALERVSLTGRGGAHFLAARKWHAAIGAGGGGTVVANCAEGEPASAKDAVLVQLRTHLVLDGLELAAETIGARRGVVWLHRGDHASLHAVRTALGERSGNGIDVRVAQGPDRYLTGESSAVVRALSGGPALPYLARRPASVAGLGGRPTLVHNAETLARVALVARAGLGAELDGPLVTVVGRQGRTVLLTRPGETFGEVVRRSGTSAADPPQAALVGGYGGTWLPWSTLADLEVTVDELHRVGASLGAGVVAPIGARTCPLVETAAILTYLAESSARQCGPCVFGLPAMAELFGRLARRRCSAGDLARLERYAAQVTGRGACHHPDGAVRMALSALSTFAVDVRRHQSGGACPGDQLPPALPVPEVAR